MGRNGMSKEDKITINGKEYFASKKLIEASKNALYPEYKLGEVLYYIQNNNIIAVKVVKIIASNAGFEYEVSKDVAPNLLISRHLLYNSKETANKILNEICY